MDSGERIARVEEQVKFIRSDVREIKNDLKGLLEFKWRLYGTSAVVAVVAGVAVELVMKLVGNG